MKRNTKWLFRGVPKSVRKTLHELEKRPKDKFKMEHTVSRPGFVKNKEGALVPYEGP